MLLVPSMIIRAEKAGTDYEKAQWRGVGKVSSAPTRASSYSTDPCLFGRVLVQDEMDAEDRRKMLKWQAMSQTDRLKNWAS